MKKTISVLFAMPFISLIIMIAGCGGGGNNGNTNNDPSKSGYTYKWSNSALTATTSAYVKPLSAFSSVVYADEPASYIGSAIPPFASLDDGGNVSGTLLIFTYYNGAQVKSTCTCDPNEGEIVDYDLGGDTVPSFVAKKEGVYTVTASYHDTTTNTDSTMTIPVRFYHFGNMSRDFDGDGTWDIQDLNVPSGYQVINNGYLSLVTSAPTGDYIQTSLPYSTDPMDVCGKIYIIKTSLGKYCKIYPTGGCSNIDSGHIIDYLCIYYLSDSAGNFDY